MEIPLAKPRGRPSSLSDLPVEMIFEIASWLEVPGLNALSRTSSQFHAILCPKLLRRALTYQPTLSYSGVIEWGAGDGRLTLVQDLLSLGADVIQIHQLQMALDSAAEGGHLDVVKLLLDKCSNISAAADGAFALYLAASNDYMEVAQFLRNAGATLATCTTTTVTSTPSMKP